MQEEVSGLSLSALKKQNGTPHTSAREPRISISAKEPHISTEEPHISAKEPHTAEKEH